LNFIKEEYGNPPIIITENGMSERGPIDLNDVQRSYYFEKYINQVLKGIKPQLALYILIKTIDYISCKISQSNECNGS